MAEAEHVAFFKALKEGRKGPGVKPAVLPFSRAATEMGITRRGLEEALSIGVVVALRIDGRRVIPASEVEWWNGEERARKAAIKPKSAPAPRSRVAR